MAKKDKDLFRQAQEEVMQEMKGFMTQLEKELHIAPSKEERLLKQLEKRIGIGR